MSRLTSVHELHYCFHLVILTIHSLSKKIILTSSVCCKACYRLNVLALYKTILKINIIEILPLQSNKNLHSYKITQIFCVL